MWQDMPVAKYFSSFLNKVFLFIFQKTSSANTSKQLGCHCRIHIKNSGEDTLQFKCTEGTILHINVPGLSTYFSSKILSDSK